MYRWTTICLSIVLGFIMQMETQAQDDRQTRSVTQKRPIVSPPDIPGQSGIKRSGGYGEILPRERLETAIIPLEGTINPEMYVLGPGDILVIHMIGEINQAVDVQVMPQGNIIMPTVGTIDVKDMTISDAQAVITDRIKPLYPASAVTVSLKNIRSFIVYISGEVNRPGNYIATPVDRISNVLSIAGGMTPWAESRHVEFHQRNGTVMKIDYTAFEKNGDLTANPLVRGGEVIHIPRLRVSKGTVFIEGNVAKPGHYQYYEGETIGDLLRRSGIEKETTDWEAAVIKRDGVNGVSYIPVDFTEEGTSMPEAFLLQDGDHITLPRKIHDVFVEGAVRAPGRYSYLVNLKASDYIGMAGRTDRSGTADQIIVIRRSTGKKERGADIPVERGDTVIMPLASRHRLLEYLSFVGPVTSIIITVIAVRSI